MLRENGAPLSMINDYIILFVAMFKGALATYDEMLRRLVAKRHVVII